AQTGPRTEMRCTGLPRAAHRTSAHVLHAARRLPGIPAESVESGGGTMRPSIATMLVALARERFELFHDEAREAWAWDWTDAHRIGSAAFAERLGADLFESTGKVAPSTSLSTAANTLRGIARWEGPETQVALRIAGQDGSVVVDLADARR